jgi:hypothetical protein
MPFGAFIGVRMPRGSFHAQVQLQACHRLHKVMMDHVTASRKAAAAAAKTVVSV